MDRRGAILRELARRELARRSFRDFLPLVHGPDWTQTRFSNFIADAVQNFTQHPSDGAYEILILHTPPQHGKSMTITESFPAWYMMKNPRARVILSSYNEDSAERFSRRNREKIKTWGPLLFHLTLGGMNRANEFELDGYPGRLISRGIMSGITGHPANLLIIDDPVKNREEADSFAYREKLWAEWLNSLKSRLAAHAKVIVIMTPWHEDDIAARIARTEDHVQIIRLPVEAEDADPLGRKPGEPLCPELGKNARWLEQFKKSYLNDPSGGQRAWLALYQCRPRAEKGTIIRRDWWHFYDPEIPREYGTQCISVDAAFKGGEKNDFVAITVWGKRGEDYDLLDCRNEHLDFIQTLAAIREVKAKFPAAQAVLIEDKANGSAVIDVLQKELFCIPVDPKGDKKSRVYGASPAIESGHVFLPRNAPWLEEYLDQWTAFPAGKHDDMVDSSTQALSWLLHASGGYKIPENTRKQIEDERRSFGIFTGNDIYDVYGEGDAWDF